jgi:2-polyprenyl-6-methoxyphenol hydroxylase-like FAD-dependent oxidoreductase
MPCEHERGSGTDDRELLTKIRGSARSGSRNRMVGKHAIIAGAGPGGLAAAIALQQAGLKVTVCERNTSLKPVGSGLTLWPNALRALDRIGLLNDVVALGAPLASIAMRCWNGTLIFADDVLAAAGDQNLPGIVLLRTDLIGALARRVTEAKTDAIMFDAEVVDFEATNTRVIVELGDGRGLSGDMLIGADGLHSRIRARLLGHEEISYAGYLVWRSIANGDFADDTGTVWMGPGRQFGCFPLPHARTYWFACEKAPEQPGDWPRPISGILQSFADWASPIESIIRATPEATLPGRQIYERATLQKWSYGRVTMLGDAAHPAVPTLGQGGCQAIEDAVVLGRCCAEHEDIDVALLKYQARRLARANSFVHEAHLMGKLGLWQNPLAIYMRDTLMRAVPASLRRTQLAKTFDFAS